MSSAALNGSHEETLESPALRRIEYAVQPERRRSPRASAAQAFAAGTPVSDGTPEMQIPGSLLAEWRRNESAGVEVAEPAGAASGAEEATAGGDGAALLRIAELEAQLVEAEKLGQRKAATARAEGYEQARQELQSGMMRRVEQEREQIGRALEQFAADRDGYFRRVEREVVRLALAIAARVLHREAQMDPLLLGGAVRVALEKLADTSELVLRTAPVQVMAWQEMFRLGGDARVRVEVIGDMNLQPGECILETRLGTVELGVKAQLEEIEKGFFDLLDQKPRAVR